MKPVIIINFKTYPAATGKQAVKLAALCEQMGRDFDVDVRVAVQATDIYHVAEAVSIPVYAQHVDPVEAGKTTGWTTVGAIKAAGASGSLVNHAEHQLDTAHIKVAVAQLRKAKLDACVCAESIERLHELNDVKPTFLCVEPPELIGGDVSVSVANPEIIKHAVHAAQYPLLVGAGVKKHKDVDIALELGAQGVLLASGIVCAKHWEKAFKKLLHKNMNRVA
ncbi:MAG: triose-phosphate isomerase [Candidatus Woesearchaeota archaeon]|nr:triose-phosphate isomerase [Candidatus Woesearchaeota archaeon]